MAYTLTVLYPNELDADYDLDYYVSNHMPLVQRHWEKYGIHSWSVTRFNPSVDGTRPLYTFGCTIHWESEEGVQKAFKGPEAAEVLGDIAKFSNKQPIFLLGERIATT
ncbi:hypothetical protein BO94DRAFT_535999 [Aspergillus sclerotioniger CBS 115572]|uniref:EthD domain-containing protein n=1 Tax=Aspergillus sclerotioniger CBS 115572 TaxID=1450535 RepID=A0A317WKP0_9EURO|nr:hypothetical protein BO94DRAFT_535999 [Aspergillus sclerotioniger CBS 115572]PWY85862.1 hypothetical protein BO94DRAFT_535999 [Aspergillus sclerotioniger CBS 115572]